MNYNIKRMFTPRPKIYNEEDVDDHHTSSYSLSSSSSDETISNIKKLNKKDSKKSITKKREIKSKSKSKFSSLTNIFKDIFTYGYEPQRPMPRNPVIRFS